MTRPRITQVEEQIGFYWVTPSGEPILLSDLVVSDPEPDRLVPTHVEAIDDALIIAAGRFGELLGGGRRPDNDEEREGLRELHRVIDRLCHEYATALKRTGLRTEIRAGQIIGTAALIGMRARMPLGLIGPAPLEGQLTEPSMGVVSGFGEMRQVDPERPWKGGRWVVRTEDGQLLPAALSMLMFDSSGVNKDSTLREHREALQAVLDTADAEDADPAAVACAIDWLLYDWLMAHRDGPDSGAVEIKGGIADAEMIVAAAAASAKARAEIDPGLLGLPSETGPGVG